MFGIRDLEGNRKEICKFILFVLDKPLITGIYFPIPWRFPLYKIIEFDGILLFNTHTHTHTHIYIHIFFLILFHFIVLGNTPEVVISLKAFNIKISLFFFYIFFFFWISLHFLAITKHMILQCYLFSYWNWPKHSNTLPSWTFTFWFEIQLLWHYDFRLIKRVITNNLEKHKENYSYLHVGMFDFVVFEIE